MTAKLMGVCMVVGAASAGGGLAAQRVRLGYERLRCLQRIICQLRSEIQYARACLPEAFQRIGTVSESPYKEWLLSMAERMEERRGLTFAQIWEERTWEYLKDAGMPNEAVKRLAGFGSHFGTADVSLQVRALDLYQEEVGRTMEELRGEMQMKIRLCHCLGVMSGIFVAVLLL